MNVSDKTIKSLKRRISSAKKSLKECIEKEKSEFFSINYPELQTQLLKYSRHPEYERALKSETEHKLKIEALEAVEEEFELIISHINKNLL